VVTADRATAKVVSGSLEDGVDLSELRDVLASSAERLK